MALFPEFDSSPAAERAERAFALPLGAASPLWAAYVSATAAGMGFWWMSQMTRPFNVEALSPKLFADGMGPFVQALAAMQPEPFAPPADLDEAALEPVREAVEPLVETAEAVTEAVAEAADAVIEQAVAEPDDLTRLTGVGPTLASKLAGLGVTRFADIAAWTEEDVERFDKSLKLMGRARREAWIDQARQLAEA